MLFDTFETEAAFALFALLWLSQYILTDEALESTIVVLLHVVVICDSVFGQVVVLTSFLAALLHVITSMSVQHEVSITLGVAELAMKYEFWTLRAEVLHHFLLNNFLLTHDALTTLCLVLFNLVKSNDLVAAFGTIFAVNLNGLEQVKQLLALLDSLVNWLFSSADGTSVFLFFPAINTDLTEGSHLALFTIQRLSF